MNKDLQYILDFIKSAEHLSEKEKADLTKSVKNADKELTISEFKLERTEKVKKTTAILLEETIEELEQKRKAVEDQNRELEIEASLERVRSAVLEMKKQDDLMDVVKALIKELNQLGFTGIRNTQIDILDDEKKTYLNYLHSDYGVSGITEYSYDSSPVHRKFIDDVKSSPDALYFMEIKGKELDEWREQRKKTDSPDNPKLEKISALYFYSYSIGTGAVGVSTFDPIDNSKLEIIKKFRNVFFLSYRRFRDIVLAEKQAREAEIQLALERVRARTMAMHQSDELAETAAILFQQMTELGVSPERITIGLIKEETKVIEVWSTDQEGIKINYQFNVSLDEPTSGKRIYEAWKEKKKSLIIDLSGQELNDWIHYVREVMGMTIKEELVREHRIHSVAFFSQGLILTTTPEPLPEESIKLLERFADVFNLTYRRFLDLKKVEAQAREAEIQLALERVRARTMAMHQSDELAETAAILFQQMTELGVTPERLNICLIKEEEKVLEVWATDQEGTKISHHFNASLDEPTTGKRVYEAWKEKKKSLIIDLSGQELNDWIRYVREVMGMTIKAELVREHRIHSVAFFSQGMILTTTPEPLPKESIKLLERFADVFNLTYRRFLDLQNAEAQARESEIQLALERVRARTMAMQSSNEMQQVANAIYEQMKVLGLEMYAVTLGSPIEIHTDYSVWVGGYDRKEPLTIPYNDSTQVQRDYNAASAKRPELYVNSYSGKAKKEYMDFLLSENSFPKDREKLLRESKAYTTSVTFAKNSHVQIIRYTDEPYSDAENAILIRFGKVFEQAYIRFLDLQKAEAQAREAQIEAALERVRSRSMGMHKSNELKDVVRLLYKEFRILVTDIDSVNIQLNPDSSRDIHFWASVGEDIYPELYHLPCSDLPIFEKVYNAFNSPGEGFFDYLLNKEEKDAFFSEIFKIQPVPHQRKKMIQNAEGMVMIGWFHKHSGIDIVHYNLKRFGEEEKEIVKRFAAAFEQTYIRFLDLQKAEAQAREANIVAALERVRSLALGMRKSEEVGKVTDSFFSEFKKLTVKIIGCSMIVADEKSDSMEIWRARSGLAVKPFSKSSLSWIMSVVKENSPEWYSEFREALGSKKGYMQIELSGEERLRFLNNNSEQSGFTPRERERYIKTMPPRFITSFLFFKLGYLALTSEKELPEENLSIARRFVEVFDFAYTRFLDLQKAEAQAREAIKQASLDRVRGEIASMRTTEDLNRITPIIWHELKTLEVPFIRCGVFIIDEDNAVTHVYLTTPEGKSLGVLNLSFDANELTTNTVEYWKKKQVYKEHWNKEEFISWTKSMMKLGQVQNPETYQGSSAPPESLNLHFVPFTQGMLYVGDVSPLADEKLDLVKTLAEAFSIAYARYEDFKNLEEAKSTIEATLKELKSAQAQLVHSEKMASLGELTAGIAHEIKNPLNFVNNFSEVSSELIDEMIEELEKGNNEDVFDIVKDLKQNLEKINNHGKRADSIVKGMLLHSRGTSGEKMPTDINDLLEQYVNLAYHGMRAQNKDFNITIERDYDKTLEKINVVPQDISRVFLNIINNGCYAANDKKKKGSDDFSPTLKVSTKNLEGES